MSSGGLVVLVIDDDAAHGRIVKRQLETYRHMVLLAASPKEAFRMLDDASLRHPQVIVLDVVLGRESGLVAIADLMARCMAPIVIMSGHFDEDMRQNALLLGAKAAVAKPLDVEALELLLRKLTI